MTSYVLEDKDAYLALVDRFPLVPIHGERHLNQAITIIDELTGREALAPGEEQYLEVLSDLIERYEEERHPIGGASPAETLRFLMESNGLRQADLAHLFSSKSNLSEVLAGRRGLSQAQMVRLAEYFRVSPALFLPASSNTRRIAPRRTSVPARAPSGRRRSG